MGKTVQQVAAELNISLTAWIVDEVPGVYHAFQVVSGTYKPEEPYDWTSREASSNSSVRRFGPGSGLPIKVAPGEGGFVPDRDHAFKGSLRIGPGGDATYLPGEKACAALGIDLNEWSSGINLLDLSFLPSLQKALYGIDYPAGTSPGPILPPSPPVQPPGPPPVVPPGAIGLHPLSPAGVRAEELRALFSAFTDNLSWGIFDRLRPSGAALSTGWPVIRPFAVEGVRLYRRLRAKLGDTRDIPAEDR